MPLEESDPVGILPAGEEWYLLIRPADHQALAKEILTVWIGEDGEDLEKALSRTDEMVLSGVFTSPRGAVPEESEQLLPSFSASFQGDYPAFFLRRSLGANSSWEKTESHTYRGPGKLVVDTTYHDTLLAVNGVERLGTLRQKTESGDRGNILPQDLAEWWRSGEPGVLAYLPGLASFPTPEGLKDLPEGSGGFIALIPVAGGVDDNPVYSLDLSLEFPDNRSARVWSLGLRVFLAARLGNSPFPDDRGILKTLEMETVDTRLVLSGWVMDPLGWSRFLSHFKSSPDS